MAACIQGVALHGRQAPWWLPDSALRNRKDVMLEGACRGAAVGEGCSPVAVDVAGRERGHDTDVGPPARGSQPDGNRGVTAARSGPVATNRAARVVADHHDRAVGPARIRRLALLGLQSGRTILNGKAQAAQVLRQPCPDRLGRADDARLRGRSRRGRGCRAGGDDQNL